MDLLTSGEFAALRTFLDSVEGFSALKKVCKLKTDYNRRLSAGALQQNPPQTDAAVQYAMLSQGWQDCPNVLKNWVKSVLKGAAESASKPVKKRKRRKS